MNIDYIFSKYYNEREKIDGTKLSDYMTIYSYVLSNYKNHNIETCCYKKKCFLCDFINKKKILGIKNEYLLNRKLYSKDEIIKKIKIII